LATPYRIGSEATISIFDEELERCTQAFNNQDIDEILRLIPGKKLLAKIAPKTGCKDTAALARAAYKHLKPESFPPLRLLKEEIQSSLGLSEALTTQIA